MNALYGVLGSGKGGIYPLSAPLASAITARGRELIVLVKETIERRFWLRGAECGGFEGEPCPEGGEALRTLYGDTDSVMVLFDGCSLQQAAAAAERIERFFVTDVLVPPQKLAFEKVLSPCAFYKKKMYAALKF